jgi:hypothetical protein
VRGNQGRLASKNPQEVSKVPGMEELVGKTDWDHLKRGDCMCYGKDILVSVELQSYSHCSLNRKET